ncbi:MAG: substrate-binding domain-containing protein [Alphaproteobacteria bacterium]
MATIRDVARESGVSVTTVSHVVNATRRVAPDTMARVRAAIENLGYHPSGVARALQASRTYTVGMIVTSSTNPFFAEVIRGVETRCFEAGYSLILCNTGDVYERLNAYLRTLMTKRIDGLVVMTTNISREFFARLDEMGTVPSVALDTDAQLAKCVVNDDSLAGGKLAGRYLGARGFRRIGCITGHAGHPRSAARIAGVRAGLAEHAGHIDPDYEVASDLTVGGGYQATKTMLGNAQNLPQAIFACNDLVAMGALCAIHEHRLNVPDDISVMGYDDIELAAYTSPPLTTIRQPAFELGVKAAELLIEGIEAGEMPASSVELMPQLAERASVGHMGAGGSGQGAVANG